MVYQDLNYQTAAEGGAPSGIFVPRAGVRWLWYAENSLGSSAVTAHLVNLGLHVLVSLAVGGLAFSLCHNFWVALLAGAVMLLNPIQSEAVSYLSARTDLIATLGIVLACWLAVGSMSAWQVVALGAAVALALLGKEVAVALIVLLPMMQKRWTMVISMFLFLIALCYIMGPGYTPNAPKWPYFFYGRLHWITLQATAAVRMIGMAVMPWPRRFTADYDYETVAVLWQLASVTIIGTMAWYGWTRRSVGALWVLAFVLPRLVVVTPLSYFNEHQFYGAMPGFAISAARFLVGGKAWR